MKKILLLTYDIVIAWEEFFCGSIAFVDKHHDNDACNNTQHEPPYKRPSEIR